MDISRIRALRGPNLWSRHTAIEAIVACAPHERAVAEWSGFEARLRELFPAIGALRPDANNSPRSNNTSGFSPASTGIAVRVSRYPCSIFALHPGRREPERGSCPLICRPQPP